MIRSVARFLHRVASGAASRARNIAYRSLGVRLAGYVWMRRIRIPRNWSDISLEHDVALDDGVVLQCSGPASPDKLRIGAGTYVNRYTVFDAHGRLHVGRNCMIGPHCYITDADHQKVPGLSVKAQPMRQGAVVVEDEVWIGAHTVILPGVTIGRGAVIGAGSVVTRDVPADAIALGSPARVVGSRSGATVTA